MACCLPWLLQVALDERLAMTDTDALLATVRAGMPWPEPSDGGWHWKMPPVPSMERARKALIELDSLAAELRRHRAALSIIASRTYPASYVGEIDGVKHYGAPDDASNYARRILDGEQVT